MTYEKSITINEELLLFASGLKTLSVNKKEPNVHTRNKIVTMRLSKAMQSPSLLYDETFEKENNYYSIQFLLTKQMLIQKSRISVWNIDIFSWILAVRIFFFQLYGSHGSACPPFLKRHGNLP